MRKILITGGLGYLGGRMVKYFLEKDFLVRITTRKSQKSLPRNIPINCEVMHMDYGSKEQLQDSMHGVDILIHLAVSNATSFEKDPENKKGQHVELIKRLLCTAKSNNLSKFIYISTIHVYGKNLCGIVTESTEPIPVHPYAQAHLEAEQILVAQAENIAISIFRCSNSFGSPLIDNGHCWKYVVNNLCRSAFQNGSLIINSSGEDYRDFIAVEDIIRAVYCVLELNSNLGITEIYNLGSSKTLQIIDIAKKIQKELRDNFNYDCPIEISSLSNEIIKTKQYVFSTKKINKLGYISMNCDWELNSLLKYCSNKYF